MKTEMKVEPENRKKTFFSVLAITILIVFGVMGYNSCNQHKSIADKPTEEKVRDILDNTVFAKQMKTGLCWALSESVEKSDKPFVNIDCIPCDSLKKVHVYKVP